MKVFELLIYAIAALALIVLFYLIIQNFFPAQTNIGLIKTGIKQANTLTSLGQTVALGPILFYKDTSLAKEDLEEDKKLIIVLECNDPAQCCIRKTDAGNKTACTNSIDWDYDFLKVKSTKEITTSVRCVRYEGQGVCTVYTGKLPAQASITKVELLNGTNSDTEIRVTVKNTGSNQLSFGKNTLTLYKKSPDSWIQTDYTQEAKELDSLMPKETAYFVWSLAPQNAGEYKATFKFEGLNSGYDEESIIFDRNSSALCKTDQTQTDTLIGEETGYNEVHYCTGCTYSYECAQAWNKKIPAVTFYPTSKDEAYCKKSTYDGSC